MAETVGTVTNIKVYTFLSGSTSEFDTCTVTLNETSTRTSWLFYLWNAPDTDTPVHRVTQSERLALLREAAFRKLTVHIYAESDSGLIDGFQVDIA
jgi:hypothetical protein